MIFINIVPIILLIPLINWLVPIFVKKFSQWRAIKRIVSLVVLILVITGLFWLEVFVDFFQAYSFDKRMGDLVHISVSAEFSFLVTLGVSLFIILLLLNSKKKSRWFVSFISLIAISFVLFILSSQLYLNNKFKEGQPLILDTAHYHLLRQVGKTTVLRAEALKEVSAVKWRNYLRYDLVFRVGDNFLTDIELAAKHSPEFLAILIEEKGLSSEFISEVLE